MSLTKTELDLALASIDRDITIITWLTGVLIALNATILVKLFFP